MVHVLQPPWLQIAGPILCVVFSSPRPLIPYPNPTPYLQRTSGKKRQRHRQEITSLTHVLLHNYVLVCMFLCIHLPTPSLPPKPRKPREQTVPTSTALTTVECQFLSSFQRPTFFLTSWLGQQNRSFDHIA